MLSRKYIENDGVYCCWLNYRSFILGFQKITCAHQFVDYLVVGNLAMQKIKSRNFFTFDP